MYGLCTVVNSSGNLTFSGEKSVHEPTNSLLIVHNQDAKALGFYISGRSERYYRTHCFHYRVWPRCRHAALFHPALQVHLAPCVEMTLQPKLIINQPSSPKGPLR